MSDLYQLTDDHRAMQAAVREMVEKSVAPRAAEIDAKGEYPWDIRKLFAEHDILGLPFEERYGGTGTDTLMLVMVIAEIARACVNSSLILAVQDLGSLPIRLAGSEEQKQRWLPKLASGEWSPAFALSEPEAGSDAASVRTRAVQDGDEWVLNGEKNWITNSGVADLYAVFARTDADAGRGKGITCFVVEKDTPGFSIGNLEHKLGIRGSPTGSPVFQDCRVPAENVIGNVGDGFRVAMATLDRSRLGIAAQALGIAEGAAEYAKSYARERKTFGKPIAEHQAIQFKIADMETGNAAGRALLYQAAAKVDREEPDMGKYSAMAKLFNSDHAMHTAVEAVQVLGGYGYVTEYPVERMLRDAKITQIYEGTNEIQRVVIGRAALR
jgi:alkylation response protein AidB-like acyl-CoA dehydrogenase